MSGPLQKHVSAAGAPEAASPRRRRAMPSGGGGGCDPAAGAPCQGAAAALGAEDHDLRQFWNAPGTQRCFVELCRLGRADGPVALLSAPSVFFALDPETQKSAWLLEFDRRWEPGNEHFVFFDYREPAASLPGHLLGRCGMVLADPPHINVPTLERYAEAMRALLAPQGRLLLVTAADNEQWAAAELGAFPAAFVPKQSAAWAELGRFRLFANFRGGPAGELLAQRNEEDFPPGTGSNGDSDGAEEDYAWGVGMVDHPL